MDKIHSLRVLICYRWLLYAVHSLLSQTYELSISLIHQFTYAPGYSKGSDHFHCDKCMPDRGGP